MRIVLTSGREVSLGVLNQKLTYAGVLCGKLDARANKPIIDTLLEDAKRFVVAGGNAHLIGPDDISAQLPAVACVAELQSGVLRRKGSEPYSSMTIAWFQGEFALPIAEDVLRKIRAIDCEGGAVDWCW